MQDEPQRRGIQCLLIPPSPVSGPKNRRQIELQPGEQPSGVLVACADGALRPTPAYTPQNEHFLSGGIDDPVFAYAKRKIFLALFDIIPMMRAGRDDFDDNLRDPCSP